MKKRTAVLGILVGAILCLIAAQPNATQTRPPETIKAGNGRWAIVNGTPELAHNIMLLDTQTGDAWILCNSADGETNWCTITRTSSTTSTKSASGELFVPPTSQTARTPPAASG